MIPRRSDRLDANSAGSERRGKEEVDGFDFLLRIRILPNEQFRLRSGFSGGFGLGDDVGERIRLAEDPVPPVLGVIDPIDEGARVRREAV